MTNLSVFDFENNSVRITGTPDKPEWIACDVARILEIQNIRQNLTEFDDDEKGVCSVYTLGGNQELATVTEPGLYRLIFKSRKPVAKRFKRWVFHDILPSIRKTGSYDIPVSPIKKASETSQNHPRFLETAEVSLTQLKVYCLLKDTDRWMSALELAEGCGVGKSTAARHCLYFQRAGIFDMIEVSPKHRYRFSVCAEKRNPALFARMETAISAIGNPFTMLIGAE
ncbi:MAG TPA: BRO family protein [Cyanophyceae cyanobacterium]